MRGTQLSMLKLAVFQFRGSNKQQLGDWGAKLCQTCIYPWDSRIVRLKHCKAGIAALQYEDGLWPKMLCACVCVQMWLKQGLANQLRLRSPPYHPYYYPYPSPEWSVHEWSCSCCGIWVSFGARRRAAWEAHEQEASFADRLWSWCASKRLLKRITPSMCTVQRWKMLSSGQLAATSPHLSPTAVQHGATWARLGASWA